MNTPNVFILMWKVYYYTVLYYFNKQYFDDSNIWTVPTQIKTKITTPSGEDLRRLHPSAIALPFQHHRRYTRIFRHVNTVREFLIYWNAFNEVSFKFYFFLVSFIRFKCVSRTFDVISTLGENKKL